MHGVPSFLPLNHTYTNIKYNNKTSLIVVHQNPEMLFKKKKWITGLATMSFKKKQKNKENILPYSARP